MPKAISSIPGIMDIIFLLIRLYAVILFPMNKPVYRNINWKSPTAKGIRIDWYPASELPIPTPMASNDRAKPSRIDSLKSMVPDLSKSTSIGFLMTCIVIPKDLIAIFKSVPVLVNSFLQGESFFFIMDCSIIQIPIKKSIPTPIKLDRSFERMLLKVLPKAWAMAE